MKRLPLTKVRAAQLAGVTERAIRAAIDRGYIDAVQIAEGTDGVPVVGVPADFLTWWQPDPERVNRLRRAREARAAGSSLAIPRPRAKTPPPAAPKRGRRRAD